MPVKKVKQASVGETTGWWIKKIISESVVVVSISLILMFIGNKLFGISPNESIKINDSNFPLFIFIVLFFYHKFFCTFPKTNSVAEPTNI